MLCCIGDLVEDVIVWPSASPKRGTDTPARIFRRRGGSAANVAVLAAELGTPTRFVGQVGDDRLGALLIEELTSSDVEVLAVKSGRTGTVVVLIEPGGERTMLPDRGAATELDVAPSGALDGITWMHVPAYSLVTEPLATTTRRIIAAASERAIRLSVDASSTGLVESFGVSALIDLLGDLLPAVLFCNTDEASLLGVSPEQPFAGAALTVVKAGPEPVVLITDSGESTSVPVPRVGDVRDTTGAGDAFAAGFVTAKMQGATNRAAADTAIRVAATVLSRPGAGAVEH